MLPARSDDEIRIQQSFCCHLPGHTNSSPMSSGAELAPLDQIGDLADCIDDLGGALVEGCIQRPAIVANDAHHSPSRVRIRSLRQQLQTADEAEVIFRQLIDFFGDGLRQRAS